MSKSTEFPARYTVMGRSGVWGVALRADVPLWNGGDALTVAKFTALSTELIRIAVGVTASYSAVRPHIE